ncbi:MAG: phosphoribosylanthranilate isomerase [Solobacterium sp.]|nr:phosphoribosylanthranilate isomerase [Solobacterium sp.]
MFAQIYSMQSVEEALACVKAGADRIGVLTEEADGAYPCGVSKELCKEIFKAVGNQAVKVLISVKDNEEAIIAETKELNPDVLHLCAEYRGNPSFREKLRAACPDVLLMEAVGVTGEEAIEDAIYRASYADIILLDTVAVDVPGIGAAGKTHDWSIDRRIKEAVTVPVILAGGLGPENVLAAMNTVHPDGVDSLTATSIKENGKLVRKDIARVTQFCDIVHQYQETL